MLCSSQLLAWLVSLNSSTSSMASSSYLSGKMIKSYIYHQFSYFQSHYKWCVDAPHTCIHSVRCGVVMIILYNMSPPFQPKRPWESEGRGSKTTATAGVGEKWRARSWGQLAGTGRQNPHRRLTSLRVWLLVCLRGEAATQTAIYLTELVDPKNWVV